MDQSISNTASDKSGLKYFNCDTCNSLLPAPGFYCVQCEPPSGPDSIIEDELTFSQAMLRICLLALLFSVIAIFRNELQIRTYFILALINGSFVIGRTLGIFLDGMPDQTLWTIFAVDLAVFLLCFWRYRALKST